MPFPFNLNGNVWAQNQFDNVAIATNLGPFLYDLLKDRHSKNYCTSTSSKTYVTGSTVFTVEAGRKMAVGMPVMIGSTSAGTLGSWMFGYVTAYVGTSLTINITAVYPEAGANASWVIFPGHYVLTRSSPLPVADGGFGTNAADTARGNVGLYLPAQGMSLLEDFCGKHNSYPSVKEGSQVLTSGARFAFPALDCAGEKTLAHGGCGGGGRVTFDGNYTENIIDGNHPGIAVMRVMTSNDVAFIGLGQNYFLPTSTPYIEYRVCFYLPNGLANASSDRIRLAIGFARHRYIDPAFPNYGVMMLSDRMFNEGRANPSVFTYDAFNNMGYVLLNAEMGAANNEMTAITNSSGTPAVGTITTKTAIAGGRWLTARMVRYSASAGWTCEIFDDYGTMYLAADLPFLASALDSNRLAPFIAVRKVNGSVERKVLVDYMSLRCETAAR